MSPQPRKAPWPAGKRRHPEPLDWAGICRAIREAIARRQGRLLARRAGVHRDTLGRYLDGTDLPAPARAKSLIESLYALKLYRVKAGRQP